MAMAEFASRLGAAVVNAGGNKASTWFTPHMAAASRAILDRIPLVDFVLEVRDARIPVSSRYEHMRNFPSSRRIVVLNKMDLANRSQAQDWIKHFQEQNCICYGMNSHNKDNIREFLNLLQAQVRELNRDQPKFTTTIMLVGIPNVGKSALANSLHQIGRISAAEKGKLKHAIVSPLPGETKDISSLKIASHPNIYILDTPGILLPNSLDNEMGSKLALTGAINDSLVDEYELAKYFLALLNSNNDHKRWEIFTSKTEQTLKQKKVFYTDHTHDFVVRDVRETLVKTISSFRGDFEDANGVGSLIDSQMVALREAFRVFEVELGEDGCNRIVARKLLNLYRTGRLGHYTLDTLPEVLHS